MRQYRITVFHARGGGVQTSIGDQEHSERRAGRTVGHHSGIVQAKLGEEVDLPRCQ